MGLNDSIDYHFMVVGHTKNHCDAYFGLIKREIKKQDVWTPNMMADVERSATSSSICRPGSDVQRADWKFLLAKYFKVTVYYIIILENTYDIGFTNCFKATKF